jgi:septal ring factor EnvC (AmiA/AmiB activator)
VKDGGLQRSALEPLTREGAGEKRMPVDLSAWVKGIGLSEAEEKTVLEALNKGGEKATKYIEENQLRQSDYSKKMDALTADVKKKETELATKIANEDKYHDSLASWDTKRKKELSDATAAREKAEAALAAARDKVTKLAADNDLPADEIAKLFEGAPVSTNVNQNTNQNVDTKELDSRFVSKEMFQAEARAYGKFAALIPGLERQYFKLFGDTADPPNWEALIDKAIAANGAKNIKQIFEEEYKISEKREELKNAETESRIKAAREEGATQERAKLLADNPTLSDRGGVRSGEREGSPVLALATKQRMEAEKGKAPVASQNPVAAAVAAFNSGKYKVEDKKAAA